MASSDIPQIHVQHEQESSYTRPIETDQSSSVNDAQEVQTPTAEAGNGKKPDYVDDIELTDPNAMKTFKSVLAKHFKNHQTDLQILLAGRTGTGKSSLVNGILETCDCIAEEGAKVENCTSEVTRYFKSDVIPGVNVSIFDAPGLQDLKENEYIYMEAMKRKCREVNQVLYCMKMTEHRLTNDDKLALKKLTEKFGVNFWKYVLFVLTFANKEDCYERDERDEDEKLDEPSSDDEEGWDELVKKRFMHRTQLRKEGVKKFLIEEVEVNQEIVAKIHFVPAGTYKKSRKCHYPLQLHDRDNWLGSLLEASIAQMKDDNKCMKLNLSQRFHLAIIINNDDIAVVTNCTLDLTEQVVKVKNELEFLGFLVLYFNGLRSEAIELLLKIFEDADHSDLAVFALVIFSKGKSPAIYDTCKQKLSFEKIFSYFQHLKMPKLFLFHLRLLDQPKEEIQPLHSILPPNSIALSVTEPLKSVSPAVEIFVQEMKNDAFYCNSIHSIFRKIEENLKIELHQECKVACTFPKNFVLPSCYEVLSFRDKIHQQEKQLKYCRSMLHAVRHHTTDTLLIRKDDIVEAINKIRMAHIGTITAGVIGTGVGVSVGVIATVLAPVTFGGSLALLAAGTCLSVVGSAGIFGGVSMTAINAINCNELLKKAQDVVYFDQQFSLNVLALSKAYRKVSYQVKDAINSKRCGFGVSLNMGEGKKKLQPKPDAEDIKQILISASAGAFGGLVMPLGIYDIAQNGYQYFKSKKDKSGKSDKNMLAKWIIREIERALKGLFFTIDTCTYTIEGVQELSDVKQDYHLYVDDGTLKAKKTCNLTVHTVFSGGFILPEGATLVSAVYDITVEERKLKKRIRFEIQHCMDIDSIEVASKMCFAVGESNFEKKTFEFHAIEGGEFTEGTSFGSIFLTEGCILCIICTNDELLPVHSKMKYAALDYYTKLSHNYWKRTILFIKHLDVHIKYAKEYDQVIISKFDIVPFKFLSGSTLNFQYLSKKISTDGWVISPSNVADKILKKDLDVIELQEFPKLFAIELNVEATSESVEELNYSVLLSGTDLEINFSGNNVLHAGHTIASRCQTPNWPHETSHTLSLSHTIG